MDGIPAWTLVAWLLGVPLVLAIIDLIRTPRGRQPWPSSERR